MTRRIGLILAFSVGLLIMVWLGSHADWHGLVHIMRTLSGAKLLLILSIYPLAALLDALIWMFYLHAIVPSLSWAIRLWRAQLVGDAMQCLTPFGMIASETTKALLLKRSYNVTIGDAAASLILVQVVLAVGQVPFILIGLYALSLQGIIPEQDVAVLIGLSVFIALFMGLVLFGIHQRWLLSLPIVSRTDLSPRLQNWVKAGKDIEQQLSVLCRTPLRLLATCLLSLGNWVCFVIELWVISWALGKHISFADAWAIEVLVSLAKSLTFFVPGRFGAQEGAITLAFGACLGDPTLGLAVALVRRTRELVWALLSLPLGAASLRRAVVTGQKD